MTMSCLVTILLESKCEQRGTMAHEERDEDVHTWQPQTTRSRGERKGAHMRGIQMARTLDRSIMVELLKYYSDCTIHLS